MKRLIAIAAVLIVAAVLGLGLFGPGGPRTGLHIVSGSENRALEPIVMAWGRETGVDVEMTYLGSVDISRALGQGTEIAYDAVWPAHSLWIELGDTERVVKHRESILRSPVVLGLRRSIAERLGWVGREDITIQDIQAAARADEFRLAMTSATQSNSGASAYFGFLYAIAGDPDILTQAHLADPKVLAEVRDLLSQVDRSSGSSGWLKDSYLDNPGVFDAMFNYEALIIEANRELVRRGGEPFHAIYPANGLSVADSPLGYVDKGDAAKEQAFLALQAHLLSEDTQQVLSDLGRRAGLIGLLAERADPEIWNPAWGIDLTRAIAPIPAPEARVIGEALRLYQTDLRKPSLTVWVLDISGSMQGDPIAELKTAMGLLLDPEAAALNLLQPSARDVTILMPFNHRRFPPVKVEGSDPAALADALSQIRQLEAGGGTDLYGALYYALEELRPYAEAGTLFDYLPAIVAMTDGASETDNRQVMLGHLEATGFGLDVPIHSIAFGNADRAQLEELSRATVGRLFTAGSDLAKALRSAKGYN